MHVYFQSKPQIKKQCTGDPIFHVYNDHGIFSYIFNVQAPDNMTRPQKELLKRVLIYHLFPFTFHKRLDKVPKKPMPSSFPIRNRLGILHIRELDRVGRKSLNLSCLLRKQLFACFLKPNLTVLFCLSCTKTKYRLSMT